MHRRVAKYRNGLAAAIAARVIAGGPTSKLPDEALACVQGNRKARRAALRAYAGRPPRTPRDRAFKGIAP